MSTTDPRKKVGKSRYIAGTYNIGGAIRNSLALNAYVAVAGYFRWINVLLVANPLVTWMGIMPMGHLFNTTAAVLANREKNHDVRYDAVSYWFNQHSQHPDKLTIREINTQALAAVGAGSDTVAAGIQSFIYYMIRHPNAWARAQTEVQDATKKGLCEDNIVSYADAQELPTNGTSKNSPQGGLTFGDRTIPEGTIVSVSPWVIHHSKEFWGEDAHEFKPDRWLKGDAAVKEKFWIPFGAGYGFCPGQSVAKIELAMTATLVRDYNIQQVDPKQEWSWKAYFTVVPHS
ncbi:hypothetical protein HG531_012106 [Fusarium graminearum]|nr:hypothetical protein HG531_012106 [Fusarium graminearum]CAF3598247.1 unnamed protein product [Fusarium graminearum]